MIPTFGGLFSGVGLMDAGLESSGWKCVWQVEKDPWRRSVLEKRFPGATQWGDIRDLKGEELEKVDLIAGGFPCQPFSLAGRRKGQEDARWLWPEFARVLRLLRPQFVLVENVPGLLSIEDGNLFGGILGDLARLGYSCEWDLLPAKAFGAPHERYRLFLVGHSHCGRCSGNRRGKPNEIASKGCAASRHRSQELSDAARAGLAIFPRKREDFLAELAASERSDYWRYWWGRMDTLCNLCGIPHGHPHRMDGTPATCEDFYPVAKGQKDRRARIEALGDGVVTAVAEWIGGKILRAWKIT